MHFPLDGRKGLCISIAWRSPLFGRFLKRKSYLFHLNKYNIFDHWICRNTEAKIGTVFDVYLQFDNPLQSIIKLTIPVLVSVQHKLVACHNGGYIFNPSISDPSLSQNSRINYFTPSHQKILPIAGFLQWNEEMAHIHSSLNFYFIKQRLSLSFNNQSKCLNTNTVALYFFNLSILKANFLLIKKKIEFKLSVNAFFSSYKVQILEICVQNDRHLGTFTVHKILISNSIFTTYLKQYFW